MRCRSLPCPTNIVLAPTRPRCRQGHRDRWTSTSNPHAEEEGAARRGQDEHLPGNSGFRIVLFSFQPARRAVRFSASSPLDARRRGHPSERGRSESPTSCWRRPDPSPWPRTAPTSSGTSSTPLPPPAPATYARSRSAWATARSAITPTRWSIARGSPGGATEARASSASRGWTSRSSPRASIPTATSCSGSRGRPPTRRRRSCAAAWPSTRGTSAPTTTWGRPFSCGDERRRPSASSRKPSGWLRAAPPPTPRSEGRSSPRDGGSRRSAPSARRCASIPATPARREPESGKIPK